MTEKNRQAAELGHIARKIYHQDENLRTEFRAVKKPFLKKIVDHINNAPEEKKLDRVDFFSTYFPKESANEKIRDITEFLAEIKYREITKNFAKDHGCPDESLEPIKNVIVQKRRDGGSVLDFIDVVTDNGNNSPEISGYIFDTNEDLKKTTVDTHDDPISSLRINYQETVSPPSSNHEPTLDELPPENELKKISENVVNNFRTNFTDPLPPPSKGQEPKLEDLPPEYLSKPLNKIDTNKTNHQSFRDKLAAKFEIFSIIFKSIEGDATAYDELNQRVDKLFERSKFLSALEKFFLTPKTETN